MDRSRSSLLSIASIVASMTSVAVGNGMVQFRPLGTAKAKGRSTALDIYEVVGVTRAANTAETGTAA